MLTREQVQMSRTALLKLRGELVASLAASPQHADAAAAAAVRDNVNKVLKGLRYLFAGVEIANAKQQEAAAASVVATMTQHRADGYE